MLSVLIGVTAAYRGGVTDGVLSLFTDLFLVIPAFPLVVVIAAYSKNGGNTILIAVLVVTGWSYGARQLRSQTLSLRNRDFLAAARVRGERQWRIITFEILPTMTSLGVPDDNYACGAATDGGIWCWYLVDDGGAPLQVH